MTCEEFVELVTAFLEGTLGEAAERAFVAHLAECPGCERYLDQFRTTIGRLGELPPESLSGETRDRLLDAFRNWPRA